MTVHLRSFEFVPRGPTGWRSLPYNFGTGTTLVTGENGAGKTPMIRGLAYALGAKIELPPLIVAHCASVRLTIEDREGERVEIERTLGGYTSRITRAGKTTTTTNDEQFAGQLLGLLAIPERRLVGKDNEPQPPYVSLLAPLFYVDQDHGWRDLYASPPNLNFVVDQAEECVRWLLDVPQRNSSRTRKDRSDARSTAESLRAQLDSVRRSVDAYRKLAGGDAQVGAREQLEELRRTVAARLTSLVESYDGLARVDAALDADIRARMAAADAASTRLAALQHQTASLQRTRDELMSETAVLEANQVAANVFRQFCGNSDCNLFRPQDSYGRRLLYLRDQVKDIESTSGLLAAEVAAARESVAAAEVALRATQDRRRQGVVASGGEQLALQISALTKEVAAIAIRLDRLNTLDAERNRLGALIVALQKAEEEVAAMSGTRGASGGDRLMDARVILARCTLKWPTALHARNLSSDVRFDANLQPTIGGERFSPASSQSGSTRTRIVLALHAALIEASLEMGGYHPWFLILDAPKQQELHRDDLAAFVAACEQMFGAQVPPMQLVVGAKERDIFTRPPDAVWEPSYESNDGLHYLGPPNRPIPPKP